jgi:hypothetical protein
MPTTDGYTDKKVIGLFDYDKEGCENFYLLKNRCELAWNDPIHGDKRNGFYRKRKQHPCFFALLIPIPERLEHLTGNIINGKFEGFVEIENLIKEETLIRLNCVDNEEYLTSHYYKIKDSVKRKALELYSDLPNEDFDNFKPLFQRLADLFDL